MRDGTCAGRNSARKPCVGEPPCVLDERRRCRASTPCRPAGGGGRRTRRAPSRCTRDRAGVWKLGVVGREAGLQRERREDHLGAHAVAASGRGSGPRRRSHRRSRPRAPIAGINLRGPRPSIEQRAPLTHRLDARHPIAEPRVDALAVQLDRLGDVRIGRDVDRVAVRHGACSWGSGSWSKNLTLYWHNAGMRHVPDQQPRPLTGLRVVTTANALPTAIVGQVLADAGAEVWLLEPPEGSRLRSQPAWKFWARGQHSLAGRPHPRRRPGARARRCSTAATCSSTGGARESPRRLGLDADELRGVESSTRPRAHQRVRRRLAPRVGEGLGVDRDGRDRRLHLLLVADPAPGSRVRERAVLLDQRRAPRAPGHPRRPRRTRAQRHRPRGRGVARALVPRVRHLELVAPRARRSLRAGVRIGAALRHRGARAEHTVRVPAPRRALRRRSVAPVLADHRPSLGSLSPHLRPRSRRPRGARRTALRRPGGAGRVLGATARRGAVAHRRRMARGVRPRARRVGRHLPRRPERARRIRSCWPTGGSSPTATGTSFPPSSRSPSSGRSSRSAPPPDLGARQRLRRRADRHAGPERCRGSAGERRARAGRGHGAGARIVLRRTVRRHAAGRTGRPRDQGRASRGRRHPQPDAVPRPRRHQGAAGQGVDRPRPRRRRRSRGARVVGARRRRRAAGIPGRRRRAHARQRRRPARTEPRARLRELTRLRQRPTVRSQACVRADHGRGVGPRGAQHRRCRVSPGRDRPHPRGGEAHVDPPRGGRHGAGQCRRVRLPRGRHRAPARAGRSRAPRRRQRAADLDALDGRARARRQQRRRRQELRGATSTPSCSGSARGIGSTPPPTVG